MFNKAKGFGNATPTGPAFISYFFRHSVLTTTDSFRVRDQVSIMQYFSIVSLLILFIVAG